MTTRSSRRKISESLERTQQALAKKREPTKADKKSKPQSGDQSFQEPKSRKELKYQPHRSKGTKFLDPSRRAYEVSDAGELRAINKPPSREKRRRKEKSEQKRESD